MRRWPWAMAVSLAWCAAPAQPAAPGPDVGAIRARVAAYDARKRVRYASVTPYLKTVPSSELLLLLSALGRGELSRGGLSDTAWLSLQVGLIEATGMLRDERARYALEAILDRPQPEPAIARAAAEALARLGDDEAVARLLELARDDGPKRRAVLSAIGNCRRAAVAEALSAMLLEQPAPETALLLVRALGGVGNAWAWKTPVVRRRGEEGQVRPVAARALVGAFVAYEGSVRRAAQQALLVVDDPSTADLVQAARQGAPPELGAALERLARKLEHNPIR